MKKIERIEREKRFSAARRALVLKFHRDGLEDVAEDLAQSAIITLIKAERRDRSRHIEFDFDKSLDFISAGYRAYAIEARKKSGRFVGLEHAADKRDPNTPHDFLAANELLSAALSEGLIDIIMGHSLSALAEVIGCTKQNVHRMLNRGRENLSHFLVD